MSRLTLFAVLLFMVPKLALAFDFQLSSSQQDPELNDRLRGASATASLQNSEVSATGQDVLAAARADYARLVGVLYDSGFFAPVISIRINGQEADQFSSIAPPPVVRRVDIRVETGPPFRFGTARLRPVAPGTQLPESFSSDLQDYRQAVSTAQRIWTAQPFACAGQGFSQWSH